MCETRPHGRAARVATVVVIADGRYTLAATTDWALSVAMAKEVIG